MNLSPNGKRGIKSFTASAPSAKGNRCPNAVTAFLFYRIMRRLSDIPIPADTGDFRLMDRRVLDVFREMKDDPRFFRGLIPWIGFRQIGVPFVRRPRAAGQSKYRPVRLFRLAYDTLTSFSTYTAQLASLFGFGFAALSVGDDGRGGDAGGRRRDLPAELVVGRGRVFAALEPAVPFPYHARRIHCADAPDDAATASLRNRSSHPGRTPADSPGRTRGDRWMTVADAPAQIEAIPEIPNPGPKWYRIGIGDLVLLLLAIGIGQTASSGIIGDPGLGWHLRTPEYHPRTRLAHGRPILRAQMAAVLAWPISGSATSRFWLGWKAAGIERSSRRHDRSSAARLSASLWFHAGRRALMAGGGLVDLCGRHSQFLRLGGPAQPASPLSSVAIVARVLTLYHEGRLGITTAALAHSSLCRLGKFSRRIYRRLGDDRPGCRG